MLPQPLKCLYFRGNGNSTFGMLAKTWQKEINTDLAERKLLQILKPALVKPILYLYMYLTIWNVSTEKVDK